MQAQAAKLLSTLATPPLGAPALLAALALEDVADTIAVLPRARHEPLAAALDANVAALAAPPGDDAGRRAAATLLLLCLRDKKAPTPPPLLHAAQALACARGGSARTRNAVAKIAEEFWTDGREGAEGLAPYAVEILLERSVAAESGGVSSASDVKRVFDFVGALCRHDEVDLAEFPLLRKLLVRAATSALYLRVDEGKRLLGRLVVGSDVGEEVHRAILSMLPACRKSRAVAVGNVYVEAWRQCGGRDEDEENLHTMLEDILTRAVRAGSDPLATNLRSLLSAFHANKVLTGMDEMLHKVYTPILFRALTAANGLVRRNSAIILTDVYPIHNPAMTHEALDGTMRAQCEFLKKLLTDPVPIVRVVTIEGTCKLMGLMIDFFTDAWMKRALEIITSDLAYDKASPAVRAAVCAGIEFMLDNSLSHSLLIPFLPRLKNMLHDSSERVRISFMSFLFTLKEKRIVSARYFDIVPLDDLLARLSIESPAVRSKIMLLLIPSYFPMERKSKTRSEISESQVRACMDLMKRDPAAAVAFYMNVSMYVPPGALVEFCMRIASIAVDSSGKVKKVGNIGDTKGRGNRRKRVSSTRGNQDSDGDGDDDTGDRISEDRKELLFEILSSVLQSIAPSLAKESYAELRETVGGIFGGSSLKPLVVPRGNSDAIRLSCLRIASTLPSKEVVPIGDIWRENMNGLVNLFPCEVAKSVEDWAAGHLLAGFAWGESEHIAETFSALADASCGGSHSRSLGSKTSKRARRAEKATSSSNSDTIQSSALSALTVCADAIVKEKQLNNLFVDAARGEEAVAETVVSEKKFPPCVRIAAATQRAVLAAIDSALESAAESGTNIEHDVLLIRCLATTMQLSLQLPAAKICSGRATSVPVQLPSRSQIQLLDILQWASGQQTLSSAFSRGPKFALALANTVMTHMGDSAGLGNLSHSVGARYIVQFVGRVADEIVANSKSVKSADGQHAGLFFGLATLTAAYNLLESVEYAEPPKDGEKNNSPSRKCNTLLVKVEDIQSLVAAAASVLAVGSIKDGDPDFESMSTRLAELLGSFSFRVDYKGSRNHCESVASALGEALGDALEKAEEIDVGEFPSSALIALMTKSVIIMARKQPRGSPADCARQIVSAVLLALRTRGDLLCVRFTRVLTDRILDEHHGDTNDVPDGIREVCVLLASEINASDEVSDDEDEHDADGSGKEKLESGGRRRSSSAAELKSKLRPILGDIVKLDSAPSEQPKQSATSNSQSESQHSTAVLA